MYHNLHSTVLILKLLFRDNNEVCETDLHSTALILKP